MWILIFCAAVILFGGATAYVSSRIYKFTVTELIARNRRWLKLVLSIAVPVVAILILCLTVGIINAAIIFIYLVLFWLIADLIFYIIKKIRKKDFKIKYSAIAAIAVTAIYLSVAWVLAHDVKITRYSVDSDKQIGNIRIVQFADSHVGATFGGDEFFEHVQQMQRQNPDVVVITGDYVDDDTSKADMQAACAALGTLKTAYGVYFAFGNHDKGYFDNSGRGYDSQDLINELTANNVIVLEDEHVLIDNRFYIVGRKDASEKDRKPISELTAELDASKYIVVLDHQPNDYDAEAESGADLVLSGHTHGGQLIPVNLFISIANDKTYGMEKRRNTNFIVTSGISDWAIKFKTGCRSEFNVIDVNGV